MDRDGTMEGEASPAAFVVVAAPSVVIRLNTFASNR
jgi:hypothetical protein